MKKLTKITIHNIRRFGSDVVIPTSTGATILLAPNGSGKTALFEAIELALTGSVQRMQSSLDALVRDGQTKSLVRLDFDNDKFCEAQLKKGSSPIISGNHAELFNSANPGDIPYLLRLTHLLNQRGDNWLVQSSGTEAADQLDKLPIGRDAIRVNGLMIGAKRAATNLLEGARWELEEAEKKRNEWYDLKAKRNAINTEHIQSLTPIPELFLRISAITAGFNELQINPTDDLGIIRGQHRAAVAWFSANLNDINEEIVRFSSLDALIADYEINTRLLNDTIALIESYHNQKVKLEEQISSVRTEISTRTARIETRRLLRESYNSKKKTTNN